MRCEILKVMRNVNTGSGELFTAHGVLTFVRGRYGFVRFAQVRISTEIIVAAQLS